MTAKLGVLEVNVKIDFKKVSARTSDCTSRKVKDVKTHMMGALKRADT